MQLIPCPNPGTCPNYGKAHRLGSEMYRRCAESNRSNTSNAAAAAAGLDADDFSWDELDAIRAYGDDIAHVYIRGREEGIPAADLVAVTGLPGLPFHTRGVCR